MKKHMTSRNITLILLLKIFLVIVICSFIQEYDSEGKLLSVVFNFFTGIFCYLSLTFLCLIEAIRNRIFLWIIIIPAVNEIVEWCQGIGWFNIHGHNAALQYKIIDIAALFTSMLIVYCIVLTRTSGDKQITS